MAGKYGDRVTLRDTLAIAEELDKRLIAGEIVRLSMPLTYTLTLSARLSFDSAFNVINATIVDTWHSTHIFAEQVKEIIITPGMSYECEIVMGSADDMGIDRYKPSFETIIKEGI